MNELLATPLMIPFLAVSVIAMLLMAALYSTIRILADSASPEQMEALQNSVPLDIARQIANMMPADATAAYIAEAKVRAQQTDSKLDDLGIAAGSQAYQLLMSLLNAKPDVYQAQPLPLGDVRPEPLTPVPPSVPVAPVTPALDGDPVEGTPPKDHSA